MRIELITMWYNETYLAPFFLNHYSWVDTIHILLDADTTDDTEEIARRYPNVQIEHFRFPDMMDDIIKVRKINEKYRTIRDADYVIVVDSDEFIFCNELDAPVKEHLRNTSKNVYYATLWQIYQHETDKPLDPGMPVHLQRRHGDPAIASTYIKPVIARAGLEIVWGHGNHSIVYDGIHMGWETKNTYEMIDRGVTVEPCDMLQGAHWKLFDLDETIRRRIANRTKRQSHFNLRSNLTFHHHHTTVQDVVNEYEEHKFCPVVIKNRECIPREKSPSHKSIFEIILSERAFSEHYECNRLDEPSIEAFLIGDDLPEWYPHVQPHSARNSIAEDLFLLACDYRKTGALDRAIQLLEKALEISPDSLHYKVYLMDCKKVRQQ